MICTPVTLRSADFRGGRPCARALSPDPLADGRPVIAVSSGCHVGWLYEHRKSIENLSGPILTATDQARHVSKTHESHRDADRRAALAVLAEARVDEIEQGLKAATAPVDYVELRATETGLVMLRGRIGGDGDRFNVGEATVTRAAVQIASGEVGFAYILGRDQKKARLCAVCDALWQSKKYREAVERLRARSGADAGRGRAGMPGAHKPRRPRWTSSLSCAARTDRHAGASFPRAGGRKPSGVPRGHGRGRAAGRGQGVAARGWRRRRR